MKSFEQPRMAAPEKERKSSDPKSRERSMLERFHSPVGRFLSMAAIALSTEGCAAFKREFLKPTIQGLTLESGRTSGFDYDVQANQEGINLRINPSLEQQGDKEWWNKPEGVYLPPAAKKRFDAKTEALKGATEFGAKGKTSDMPNIPKSSWIKFDSGERAPTEAVVYEHQHGSESPSDMTDRALDLMLPVLNREDGVRLEWRNIRRFGPSPLAEGTVRLKTKKKLGPLNLPSPELPEDEVRRRAYELEESNKEIAVLSKDRKLRGFGTGLEGGIHALPQEVSEKDKEKLKREMEETEDWSSPSDNQAYKGSALKRPPSPPSAELRKLVPGAASWNDAKWQQFLDQQRLNEMMRTDQPHDIAFRMSPFMEPPPGSGSGLWEDAVVSSAFKLPDGYAGVSEQMSATHPDRPAQFVVVEIRTIPSLPADAQADKEWSDYLSFIENQGGDRNDPEMDYSKMGHALLKRFLLQDMAVNMAKRSALKDAIQMASVVVQKDMRFHVVFNADKTKLAVIGVVDDPVVPPQPGK